MDCSSTNEVKKAIIVLMVIPILLTIYRLGGHFTFFGLAKDIPMKSNRSSAEINILNQSINSL